jgi:uncharacterized membrane protein
LLWCIRRFAYIDGLSGLVPVASEVLAGEYLEPIRRVHEIHIAAADEFGE